MGSTPPSDFTWVLNKFNITFPTLCTPDQDPGPDSAQPAVSPDINLNLFQHFLSALKLPGISPPPAITNGPIEPIMEDIYAMFQEEIYLCLKICRLNTRDEASLTPYLRRITGKHVSESIWDQIITSQVYNTKYYDVHHVPLPSTLLKTIKKRKYIWEDLDLTYHTAQKGMTLLVVALLYEDKISPINEIHKYITGASLKSPKDIKKLTNLTSKLPNSMESIVEQLKVFANLIYALFTSSFPSSSN